MYGLGLTEAVFLNRAGGVEVLGQTQLNSVLTFGSMLKEDHSLWGIGGL